MRYIIYGAGGIGGTIGAGLHNQGIQVTLIARGEHLRALQEEGLIYRNPIETQRLNIQAVNHPREIDWQPDDVVLMTMKSQHTFAALQDLATNAPVTTPVICCQNGVANELMASRFFVHVYGMVVMLPATHIRPGEVLHHASGVGGFLDAGCYPSGVDDTITQICADLCVSGFSANADDRAMRWKYAKLLQNLGNSVQAVCSASDDTRELIRLLRNEALACYKAANVDCASAAEMKQRFSKGMISGEIEGESRGGGSSWQSLLRQTGDIESDYLNGEISLMGKLHGLATPANEIMRRLANQVAREKRQPGHYSIEDVMSRISLT